MGPKFRRIFPMIGNRIRVLSARNAGALKLVVFAPELPPNMCTFTNRIYRSCHGGHTYIERAKCTEAIDGDFWHPRHDHMQMSGNIVSGVAIKCPHCNDLHYELDQDGELDAAADVED